MYRSILLVGMILILLCAAETRASVFGEIQGLVVDQQQHALIGAQVVLQAQTSSYSKTVKSDTAGAFFFRTVPIGEYIVTVESNGFARLAQAVIVLSDRTTVLRFQMKIAPVSQTVQVTAVRGEELSANSLTPVTLINRQQVAQTPGADRTNSLTMITDFVPGSYVTHNQLHIRGGHQVTWLVDGVPVANTNIADTVGPQFDPKDIDYLEVQRGSYSAEYGDRTYGIFNVVPRSGFDRKREGELLLSYGNFNQTNEHLNFGSHTKRFAYYASVNANRSDYGLETPVLKVLHDQSNGFGGFASLIFNPGQKDQFRLVAALRKDFYQVPNDQAAQDLGGRDVERERDAFINFSWVHTVNSKLLLTVSPFYHHNRASFIGGASDTPVIANDERSSQYAGAQVVLNFATRQHNAKAGFYGFWQSDFARFSLQGLDSEGTRINVRQDQNPRGNLFVLFLEDQYRPSKWLTLTGGVRMTRFHGSLTENIPVKGWDIDASYFRTAVKNFFDHDALGNANIFFPLTIERARIRAFEVTARSPVLFGPARFHVAYSHQRAQGQGAVTGGLTDFSPPADLFFLDHDQRDTLSAGVTVSLPSRSYISGNVRYGSGFLNGDGPDHLPGHTSFDLSFGKSLGERWTIALQTVNLGNARFLLDNSNTFGGTHFVEPRQVYVDLRYRFHY